MRSRFSGAARHTTRLLSHAVTAVLLGSSMLTGLGTPAMAEEPWIMVQRDFFLGADPARGQGVTTDGTNWYFSGTHSLEIADDGFNTIRSTPMRSPTNC